MVHIGGHELAFLGRTVLRVSIIDGTVHETPSRLGSSELRTATLKSKLTSQIT
jgi:hypothetical protein